MRPSTRSAPNGGCVHSRGVALGDDVGVALEQQRRARSPSPIQPSTLGRPGATSWTSTSKPSLRSQRSTCAATAASVAVGIAGPHDAGDADQVAGELDQLALRRCGRGRRRSHAAPGGRGLLLREGQDHRVEADDAVLLERDVEVVALDLFGALLERDDGLRDRASRGRRWRPRRSRRRARRPRRSGSASPSGSCTRTSAGASAIMRTSRLMP